MLIIYVKKKIISPPLPPKTIDVQLMRWTSDSEVPVRAMAGYLLQVTLFSHCLLAYKLRRPLIHLARLQLTFCSFLRMPLEFGFAQDALDIKLQSAIRRVQPSLEMISIAELLVKIKIQIGLATDNHHSNGLADSRGNHGRLRFSSISFCLASKKIEYNQTRHAQLLSLTAEKCRSVIQPSASRFQFSICKDHAIFFFYFRKQKVKTKPSQGVTGFLKAYTNWGDY